MKCIKHGDKIIRVSDNEAITKVRDGWMYVSKSCLLYTSDAADE